MFVGPRPMAFGRHGDLIIRIGLRFWMYTTY